MEYDRLMCNGVKATAAAVAHVFNGNKKYSTKSIRQAAHIAMRLPASVTGTYLEVGNWEEPGLCLRCDKFNTFSETSPEQLMETIH